MPRKLDLRGVDVGRGVVKDRIRGIGIDGLGNCRGLPADMAQWFNVRLSVGEVSGSSPQTASILKM